MTIVIPTLPPQPAYPAAAGAERDEWHRITKLYMDAACVQSQLELAEANRACEKAQRDLISEFQKTSGSLSFEQVMALLGAAKGFINADEPSKPAAA